MKKNQNKKITIFQMLITRRRYYLMGLIIGFACMMINFFLGEVSIRQVLLFAFSLSFVFGHSCYIGLVHGDKIRKFGPHHFTFSRESLINFGLTIISLIILSSIFEGL